MAPTDEILNNHYQAFPSSCVAMAIEYILKELRIVPIGFFKYQEDRSNDGNSDFCIGIHNDKIIFKPQGNLGWEPTIQIIDKELKAGRMVYISLKVRQDPDPRFHMFVIIEKQNDRTYKLVTSNYEEKRCWVESQDLSNLLAQMNDFGIITYTLIANKNSGG